MSHPALTRRKALGLVCTFTGIAAMGTVLTTPIPHPRSAALSQTRPISPGIYATTPGGRAFPRRLYALPQSGEQPAHSTGADKDIGEELFVSTLPDLLPLTEAAQAGFSPKISRMLEAAARDLDTLTLPNGFFYAGYPGAWQYHWPRDAAFAALARWKIAKHGKNQQEAIHLALNTLSINVATLDDAGTMPARIIIDPQLPADFFLSTDNLGASSYSHDQAFKVAVPDDRARQNDGAGWTAWALNQIIKDASPELLGAEKPRLHSLVKKLAVALTKLIDPDTNLPYPSPDYWEVPTRQLTLGVAAPILSGIFQLHESARTLQLSEVAALLQPLYDRVADAFNSRFTPGYHRMPDTFWPLNTAVDAAISFAGPPFLPATTAWEQAFTETLPRLEVTRGGYKPGSAWHDAITAWTPETSLFALSYAHLGKRTAATRLLEFLSQHLTIADALPEKINRLGQPAGIAPLGWSAANVLLCAQAIPQYSTE